MLPLTRETLMVGVRPMGDLACAPRVGSAPATKVSSVGSSVADSATARASCRSVLECSLTSLR